MRRDVFQALADPTRRAIISRLAGQPMTPNALAAHFDSTRQAISKHLKILNECQLLEQHPQGREIYYGLVPAKLKEVSDWLAPFQDLWEARFDNLDQLLNHIKPEST